MAIPLGIPASLHPDAADLANVRDELLGTGLPESLRQTLRHNQSKVEQVPGIPVDILDTDPPRAKLQIYHDLREFDGRGAEPYQTPRREEGESPFGYAQRLRATVARISLERQGAIDESTDDVSALVLKLLLDGAHRVAVQQKLNISDAALSALQTLDEDESMPTISDRVDRMVLRGEEQPTRQDGESPREFLLRLAAFLSQRMDYVSAQQSLDEIKRELALVAVLSK